MHPAIRSSTAFCAVVATLFIALRGHGVSSYSATVLGQKPIGYWRFDDAITTSRADLAVNLGSLGSAANGLYSGATHPVPGSLVADSDSAARMVGGQSVRIPWSTALNPSNAVSVEGWFRPAGPAGILPLCIMSSGQFLSPRSGWLLYQVTSGVSFRLYAEQGGAASLNLTGGSPLTSGTWYHLAAVYDGAVGSLYINGVKVAEASSTGFVPAADGEFTIGIRSDNSLGWSGDADEVAIYSIALSAEKVKSHYTQGLTPQIGKSYPEVILSDAPLGYWRLGEAVFGFDVAFNSGTAGNRIDGFYRGGAVNSSEAPNLSEFIGFETNNTSASFDGKASFVSIVPGLMNVGSAFSLTGWVRSEVPPAPLSGLWGQNDRFEFGFADPETLAVWNGSALNIPNPFPTGRWSHVAIVSDDSRLLLYTNGVLAATQLQLPASTNNASFNIGGGGVFDGGGDFFNGQIDELAFFNQALTRAQVCNQYFSAIPKAPQILRQPVSATLFAGFMLRANVEVCGSPDFQYQWFKAPGLTLLSQTNAQLELSVTAETDSGQYFVRLTNPYGEAESDHFQATVLPAHPPLIERQPIAGARYVGFDFAFVTLASGTAPLRYQWQRNGVDLSGGTNASLKLNAVRAADAGRYRVKVSNPITVTFSDEAILDVVAPTDASYAAEVLRRRPVAYWRLDETQGEIAQDWVGGWDGHYQGATLGVDGAWSGDLNASAAFSGTNSGLSTSLSLSNRSAFSWIGWFRPDVSPQPDTVIMLQEGALEFGWTTDDFVQARGFRLRTPMTSPGFLTTSEWSFVVIQGDSSKISLYGNGLLLSESTNTSTGASTGKSPFTLGMTALNSGSHAFRGRVDDVAVFDRILTAEEICHLYYKAAGTPFRLEIRRATSHGDPKGTAAPIVLKWSCGSVQETDQLDLLGATVWKDHPDWVSPLTIPGREVRKYYRIRP